MIDLYVLWTPIAFLPIYLLFIFIGCQLFFPVDPYQGPVFVQLDVDLSGCPDVGSITVSFSTDIGSGHFNVTLTDFSQTTFNVSTEELGISLADEGNVVCAVTIELLDADAPAQSLPEASHEKNEDDVIEPFKLSCPLGEFVLT